MLLKMKKILLILSLSLIFLINTLAISSNDLNAYERFRDFLLILLILPLLIYTFHKISGKDFVYFLLLANILLVIIIIHFLRLIFDGLLC